VGFTGSLKGGNALSHMAATRPQPIPVFTEMSSINPVFLLPEALAVRGEQIAAQLAASVTLGCGQFCTNPGLVIGLRSPQFSLFLESFCASMNQQPAQTMLNAGALVSYSKGLGELYEHPGLTHLAGKPQQGNQAQPQVFKANVSLLLTGDELLQEEVFGPTTIVIEVEDRAQLAVALHGLRGQLTATLIGEAEELLEYRWLAEALQEKVGRILLNGYPTGSRFARRWCMAGRTRRLQIRVGRRSVRWRSIVSCGRCASRITRMRYCPRRCRTPIRWGFGGWWMAR
jgi:NAD-dependent aldehyde dehydrogenases